MMFHLEFDGNSVYVWDRWHHHIWVVDKPNGDLDFYSLRFKMSEKIDLPKLELKTFLEMVTIEVNGEKPK